MMVERRPTLVRFGGRALAVLALVLVGYVSLTRSIGSAYARVDPQLAGSISSNDARIKGLIARSIAQRPHTAQENVFAVTLARRSLARDPTVVAATSALGTLAGLMGDARAAEGWFRYAQFLSRRDLLTQLYFIERSVQAGDVATAVRHYDIALRTNDTAADLLFPVLRSAMTEPAVRTALARVLASKPLWADDFIADLVSKGPDFPSAASLLLEASRRGAPIPAAAENTLLDTLIGQGHIAEAWRFYSARYPIGNNQLIRNAEFDPSGARASPFDWRLSVDSGVTVSLDPGGRLGVLNYRVAPTVSATVAAQVILLRPGKYRLSASLLSSSQTIGQGPYWVVECSGGSPIGKLEMGGGDARLFETTFVVSSACPTQRLSLAVRSSDDVGGAEGSIDAVGIVRLD